MRNGVWMVSKDCEVYVVCEGYFCDGWLKFAYNSESFDNIFIGQGGRDPP